MSTFPRLRSLASKGLEQAEADELTRLLAHYDKLLVVEQDAHALLGVIMRSMAPACADYWFGGGGEEMDFEAAEVPYGSFT